MCLPVPFRGRPGAAGPRAHARVVSMPCAADAARRAAVATTRCSTPRCPVVATARRRRPGSPRAPCRRRAPHRRAGARDRGAMARATIALDVRRRASGDRRGISGDDRVRVLAPRVVVGDDQRIGALGAGLAMSGRLPGSRSPPQPNTQTRRPAKRARSAASAFASASGVSRVVDDDRDGPRVRGDVALQAPGHGGDVGRVEQRPPGQVRALPAASANRGDWRPGSHRAGACGRRRRPSARRSRTRAPSSAAVSVTCSGGRRIVPATSPGTDGRRARARRAPGRSRRRGCARRPRARRQEQLPLGLAVGVHGAVVVEVIAAQVREQRADEAQPRDALLIERVRGDFHRRPRHRRRPPSPARDRWRTRRPSAVPCPRGAGEAGAERAAAAGPRRCRHRHEMMGDRGLAVRAGDAEQTQAHGTRSPWSARRARAACRGAAATPCDGHRRGPARGGARAPASPSTSTQLAPRATASATKSRPSCAEPLSATKARGRRDLTRVEHDGRDRAAGCGSRAGSASSAPAASKSARGCAS